MPKPRRLRVLVVEDDAISRRYLADALLLAGHDPLPCADMESALAASATQGFDLVLTDLALPDGGGERIFALLREDPASPNHATPVVALSAELQPGTRARLHRLGFAGAMEKPIAVGALEQLVHRTQQGVEETGAGTLWASAADGVDLTEPDSPTPQDLDDSAGLAAAGSTEILAGLRRLFRSELPLQLDLVAQAIAANDRQSLHEMLHRLTASCGFCGAAALQDAVRRLDTALANSGPIPEAPVAALRDAGRRCLQKLPP